MSKNRRDAKRIEVSGLSKMMTYLKDRQDSDVYINKKIDVEELVKYIKSKKENNPDITYFHAFAIAFAKVIYNRPKLNRYILNHNFYERNDVSFAFEVKVNYEDNSKACLTRIIIKENDNINSIKDKIKKNVSDIRQNKLNDTDGAVDMLDKLPKFVLRMIVPVIKWMDRHDLLPKSFNDNLIYNSTAILSNLGSIKCGAIYHNITDFSTNSILVTMGDIHKEAIVNDKDQVEVHNVVDFGITLDERIADGVYFAKAVNMLEYILKNPKLLEEPANESIKEKENFKY